VTAIAAPAAAAPTQRAQASPVVICLLHPKGGVGRSTTAWHLGAELALRGRRVVLEDLDQGRHLSRVYECHPLGLDLLTLGGADHHDLTILDTAPEAQRDRALDYLRRADWALVPAKVEEASLQALPMLLQWLQEADGARLLGFLPTMFKPRRAEARYWLEELHSLADRHHTRVFAPIHDLASLAAWRLDGHPYAGLADEVLDATNV
jgi:cellulose biosynthesis protein BcsQ